MRYSFDSRVRYSETDEKGILSIGALVDCFQDCAAFQMEDLQIGLSYLKQDSRAWMLSSWQIELGQLPRLNEEIKVWTWAYDFKAFYGYRNFLLTGRDGRHAAWANSVWVMMDLAAMKPVPVPDREVRLYDPEERLAMEYASRKIVLPGGRGAGQMSCVRREEPFTVARHQLDTNHHVNNRQYISMAEEYLPGDFHLRRIRAEYKRQARLGDVIYPQIYTAANAAAGTAGGEAAKTAAEQMTVVLGSEQGTPYAVMEFLGETDKER